MVTSFTPFAGYDVDGGGEVVVVARHPPTFRAGWQKRRSPATGSVGQVTASRFVVQLHDATTLHFDLRIQACLLYTSPSPRDS